MVNASSNLYSVGAGQRGTKLVGMTGDVTTRGSGVGGQYRVFGGTGGGQLHLILHLSPSGHLFFLITNVLSLLLLV